MGQSLSTSFCHLCRGSHYQTVKSEVLLVLLDDLLVIASVDKETFDHVYLLFYLVSPARTGFLPPFSQSWAWGLWWFLKYVSTMVMADGILSLPSSHSQCAEHPFYALICLKPVSCISSTCVTFEKGTIDTYV